MSKFEKKVKALQKALCDDYNKLIGKIKTQYDIAMEADVSDLRSAAGEEVNVFGYKPDELAKEYLADEETREFMTDIAIQWVIYWAGEGQRFTDPRNSIAAEKCRKISEEEKFRAFAEGQDQSKEIWRIAQMFADRSTRMHRTLMQSFTSVMLAVLADVTGDEDYRTGFPLI